MSKVTISKENMRLAQKSLTNLYKLQFGKDSFSTSECMFSKDELILIYAKNLNFWNSNLPETTPYMSGFVIAKHAICSNAIENLNKKVDFYGIHCEVEIVLSELKKNAK